MAKLGSIAPAREAATPTKDIPKALEMEPGLFTDRTANSNTQYRGRLAGGAIRSRVYVTDGRKAADLAGEIITGTEADITFAKTRKYDDGNTVTKVEFRDTMQEGILVVLWGPEDYEFESLKVTFG